MGRNNYPQGQIDEIEPSTVQEIVKSLKQLHDRGSHRQMTKSSRGLMNTFHSASSPVSGRE